VAEPILVAPPIRTLYEQGGNLPGIFSRPWAQWFQEITNDFNMLRVPNAPPATSASPGMAGQIAFDANFLYVAVAPNSWKRIPFVAF
jgi:hypothetical protein